MYKIKSTNLKWLNGWCKTFLANGYKIQANDDGWHVSQAEVAKVGMLIVKLGDLKVVGDFPAFEAGIDPGKMDDFLRGIGDCEVNVVHMEGRLIFTVEELERKMTLIDHKIIVTAKVPGGVSDMIKATIPLDIAKLNLAIKSASAVSDHIKLAIHDGKFLVIADDGAGDTVTLKTPLEDPPKTNCSSFFSIDYVESVIKLLEGKTTLKIGNDCPLIFENVPTEKSFAHFYLAPRIEGD